MYFGYLRPVTKYQKATCLYKGYLFKYTLRMLRRHRFETKIYKPLASWHQDHTTNIPKLKWCIIFIFQTRMTMVRRRRRRRTQDSVQWLQVTFHSRFPLDSEKRKTKSACAKIDVMTRDRDIPSESTEKYSGVTIMVQHYVIAPRRYTCLSGCVLCHTKGMGFIGIQVACRSW